MTTKNNKTKSKAIANDPTSKIKLSNSSSEQQRIQQKLKQQVTNNNYKSKIAKSANDPTTSKIKKINSRKRLKNIKTRAATTAEDTSAEDQSAEDASAEDTSAEDTTAEDTST